MTDAATAERLKRFALGLLAGSMFIVILDASITNVALPSIQRDLDISQDSLSWVVNSYVLAFGGFLLLGGRLADFYGRRLIYMTGLVVFGFASLLGGLAGATGSYEQLIAARILQGFGGALLAPSALAIVTTLFREGEERNKALGVWGAAAGSGGAVGVLLGGVLTEYAGWEWCLYVNTPVCALVAVVAPKLLAESRTGERASSDVTGAVLVTVALATLVYGLVDANDAGWGSVQTVGLIGLAVALLLGFVHTELRSSNPIVPFRIFRNRTLAGSDVTGLLLGAALFAMFFFITLYMQQVLGYSALRTGLYYLPLSVAIIVAAGGASQLVTRFGFKPVLLGGLVLSTVALAWFGLIEPDGSYAQHVLGPSIVAGVGLGLCFVPVTIGAVSGIDSERDSGLASGLINVAQQVGGALGLAVLVAIANGRTGDVFAGPAAADGAARAAALTDGFQAAFLSAAVITLLAIVAAAVLIRTEDSRALIGQESVAVPVA